MHGLPYWNLAASSLPARMLSVLVGEVGRAWRSVCVLLATSATAFIEFIHEAREHACS
jgi:hypothetical protein